MSYYRRYYDDDSDYSYDEYNPMDHYANDPLDFQVHGYGGFGYDTSHVPADEPKSNLCRAAELGDLKSVRRMVEGAAAISEARKGEVMNHARRWTEVDYRMSGFTKEYEWFDLTPLAAAAGLGHHDIVQYLLEHGADPTLVGCPTEDCHVDAFQAAERCLKVEGSKGSRKVFDRARRCLDLLEAAKPFWTKAKYAGSQYGKDSRKTFSNAPTDVNGLLGALGAVLPLVESPSGSGKENKTPSKTTGKDLQGQNNGAMKPKSKKNANVPPLRICSRCKEAKPAQSFSKNQGTKKDAAKCKDCVEEANKKPGGGGGKVTGTASVSAAAPAAVPAAATGGTSNLFAGRDEELESMIDDGIEDIREDAKYALMQVQERLVAVESLQKQVKLHSRASVSLKEKVRLLYEVSAIAASQTNAVVELIEEIEDLAVEDGVIPE